jgi:hypothetical protein
MARCREDAVDRYCVLTCPLKRLISFFLLVAEPAMLCGEKPAVISTVLLLLAAASPVAWESSVRRIDDYRLHGRRGATCL